jgi:hypothetical protein
MRVITMKIQRFVTLFMIVFFIPLVLSAAPKSELWPYWKAHDNDNTRRIDHSPWDSFLDAYLDTSPPSGVYNLKYKAVSGADKKNLENYIDALAAVTVTKLSQAEQKAYWINLYNALTVKVIIDHYPVKSIRDIDISPGLRNDGPWDAKLLTIEGKEISLNDIEHRILRPVFLDNRIHYAVNCASIGCPNLQPEAYTAENTEGLLDRGAREYISHSRGVKISKNKIVVSGIYNWFQEDFGSNESGVIEHLLLYAPPQLKKDLKNFRGKISYRYDWSLNE